MVTGATGGMGRAIVEGLSRDHHVFALGRSETTLAELAGNPEVTTVRCDLVEDVLASPGPGGGQPESPLAEVLGLHRVDVLVHAAAIARHRRVEEASASDWRQHLDVNVVAPAELTRRLLPAVRQASGTVIFINSGAGNGVFPGNVVYVASKHALRALADALRKEEAAAGVRVATVAPGPTDTPMLRGLIDQSGGDYEPEAYIDPVEVAAAIRVVVDAGPTTQITEVAVRPRIELADR